jgi:predicted metal-dependent phosphoesterase TrpH/DNA-binding transcriptional ArsR family regulator
MVMDAMLLPIVCHAAGRELELRRCCRRRPAVRVDLHCHSKFSNETLRWLPGVVYQPVLTPEEVYDLAKARGMDFVTLTDHDSIDGCKALVERRGPLPDFFFGEEVSARFPEDGTVVHVNVYDHTEAQHREITRLRSNIYDLIAYLRSIDKLHVLNHMAWTEQHRVLTRRQLVAVLELFEIFEGLNGARGPAHNAFVWHVTRERGKVLVGGSDSHTNRVGTTFTLSAGRTPQELLANIALGQAACGGVCGGPERLLEDIWSVMEHNLDQRLAVARGWTRRAIYRLLARYGRPVSQLVCRIYDRRQDTLMRNLAQVAVA